MGYLIVTVVSVVFVFLGFFSEVAEGNIRHIENGREPNAGAAVFPGIPFGPVFLVSIVWMLNCISDSLGYWLFAAYFFWYLPTWWIVLRQRNKRLAELADRQ